MQNPLLLKDDQLEPENESDRMIIYKIQHNFSLASSILTIFSIVLMLIYVPTAIMSISLFLNVNIILAIPLVLFSIFQLIILINLFQALNKLTAFSNTWDLDLFSDFIKKFNWVFILVIILTALLICILFWLNK